MTMRQETFGPVRPAADLQLREASQTNEENKPLIETERTPERAEDGQDIGSTDKKGASGKLLKSVSAQKLLEKVSNNTDQQLAKIKQTLYGTYESKKEILLQSGRTEKELAYQGGSS